MAKVTTLVTCSFLGSIFPTLPLSRAWFAQSILGQDTCGLLKISHIFLLYQLLCKAADLHPSVGSSLVYHKLSWSKTSSGGLTLTTGNMPALVTTIFSATAWHICSAQDGSRVHVGKTAPVLTPWEALPLPLPLGERATCSLLLQFNSDEQNEAAWQSWLRA